MAGGEWSKTDMPVLPGLYTVFQAAALAAVSTTDRGTVVVPVKAEWGPTNKFVDIGSVNSINNVFGLAAEKKGTTAYTTLYLALLGGAKKLYAYRLVGTTTSKASVTLKDTSDKAALKITAKYVGERGNDFNVTVQTSLTDEGKKTLKLYEGANLLKTWSGANVGELISAITSDGGGFITAEKETPAVADSIVLKDVTNTTLAGGTSDNKNVTSASYVKFLDELEPFQFNYLALDGIADESIQTTVASWLHRVRKNTGKKVCGVFGGSATDDISEDAVSIACNRSNTFNYEDCINVGDGVELDGTTYSSAQMSAYVAGLIAGQGLSESTTYATTPFDDVTKKWTHNEQEEAVKNGVFLFINDGRQVKALKGVNTLSTLRQKQNNAFKKIRSIRVMDAIDTDLQKTAEDNYIGKINNKTEGRQALIGAFEQYMAVMEQGGVIESGWNVELDPDYYGDSATLKPEADQVFVRWDAYITDVIEQIFSTFNVTN